MQVADALNQLKTVTQAITPTTGVDLIGVYSLGTANDAERLKSWKLFDALPIAIWGQYVGDGSDNEVIKDGRPYFHNWTAEGLIVIARDPVAASANNVTNEIVAQAWVSDIHQALKADTRLNKKAFVIGTGSMFFQYTIGYLPWYINNMMDPLWGLRVLLPVKQEFN